MAGIHKRLNSRLVILVITAIMTAQLAAMFNVSVHADVSAPPAPAVVSMWAVSVGWSDTGGSHSQYVTADGYNGTDGLAIYAPVSGAWGLFYYAMPGSKFTAGETYTMTLMAKTYNLNQSPAGAGVNVANDVWVDGAVKLPASTDGAWQQVTLTGLSGTALSALGTVYIVINPSMNTGGYMIIDDVVITKDGDSSNLVPAFSSNFNIPKPAPTVITREVSSWRSWEGVEGDFALSAGVVAGGTSGANCLQFYNTSQNFNMAAIQDLVNLPNGTYTVSADVLTSWINGAQMQIVGHGGTQLDTNCNAMDITGTWKTYTQTVIVTSGSMMVMFWASSTAANQWLAIDNVRVTLNGGDGTNYVKNGSFEDVEVPQTSLPANAGDNMNDWIKWCATGDYSTIFAGDIGHTGDKSAVIYNKTAGDGGSLSQDVSGLENGIYHLSAWVRCVGIAVDPPALVLNTTGDASGNHAVQIPVTAIWRLVSVSAEVTSGVVRISLWHPNNQGNYILVDDVSLVKEGSDVNLLLNPSFEDAQIRIGGSGNLGTTPPAAQTGTQNGQTGERPGTVPDTSDGSDTSVVLPAIFGLTLAGLMCHRVVKKKIREK